MSEGRLPHLERLARTGGFTSLATSIPPQSPVAWADFITGLDAGGHGIFDFLHRDPATLIPYLSTSRVELPGRYIRLGRWQFPLAGGSVRSLRQGVPFWEVLERHGVRASIIRAPANFPPSGSASRELSGMGTPDLLGSPGTFSFFTTARGRAGARPSGGLVHVVELVDHVLHGTLEGPPNPFLEAGDMLKVPFTVYVDPTRPVAKVVLGDHEVMLEEGEWSEWLPVEFEALRYLQTLRGMCRFYFRQVHPDVELYVTPINLDPMHPAMPVSHPPGFAAELARATGRFYTQGMPEETNALRAGILDDEDFLGQAAMAAEEIRNQYTHVLEHFTEGVLFYYFGHLDQVSHMMWRAIEPSHPAHDPVADAPYRQVIEDLYVGVDDMVGKTVAYLGDDATIIVMSDHGFAPWVRAFNLNTWLKEHGYLVLKDRARTGPLDLFEHVDWMRTQAYALGLNGVYVNVRGRERMGSVPPDRRSAVAEEIAAGLLRFLDPKTGEPAISNVYQRDEVYRDRGHLDLGPDLIVGFARGVRSSDESALGRIAPDIIVDNTNKWSGDHLMDHETVPGVLLTNRRLRRPVTALKDLAAAVLAEFGVAGFPTGQDVRDGGR
jgi:predicted AlkP superfamily phosphohydrolase/phosphomutase